MGKKAQKRKDAKKSLNQATTKALQARAKRRREHRTRMLEVDNIQYKNSTNQE